MLTGFRRAALSLALAALLFPGMARAVEPAERLADPALEMRARTLSREFRCLVCQNQSIDDSNADLAHDLRLRLRERLSAGDTDSQIRDYMVARYGNFVLLDPPLVPATYFLWLGPPFLLIGAGALLLWRGRRRGGFGRALPEGTPGLTPAEQRRAAALLGDER